MSIVRTVSRWRGGLVFLAAGALGFFAWARTWRDRAKKPYPVSGMKIGSDTREIDPAARFGDGPKKRDVVDQASWESFPASDPPAY